MSYMAILPINQLLDRKGPMRPVASACFCVCLFTIFERIDELLTLR
jgi:hypothetical protein